MMATVLPRKDAKNILLAMAALPPNQHRAVEVLRRYFDDRTREPEVLRCVLPTNGSPLAGVERYFKQRRLKLLASECIRHTSYSDELALLGQLPLPPKMLDRVKKLLKARQEGRLNIYH